MTTQTVKDFIQSNFDGKFAGDARHPLSVGDIGFLLELTPVSSNSNYRPRKRLELRPHPVRVAGTLEEVLYGRITGDRTDVEALGVARVTESVNGRGKIQTAWGSEAQEILDRLAYPELGDDLAIAEEIYE
jgi:hypothetical protein